MNLDFAVALLTSLFSQAIYNPVLRRNLNLDEELVVPIIQTANTEEEIKEELVKVMKR